MPLPGKTTDTRAAGFIKRHGALSQTELDALPLPTLKELYWDAFSKYFDFDKYNIVREQEEQERQELIA